MTPLQKHICRLTGLSEKAYTDIVEQYGIAFISYITGPNTPWAVPYLTQTKSFWTWWKQQWAIRDEIFELEYQDYANCDAGNELCDLYLEANMPKAIAGYPAQWIIQESYEAMLLDVLKEKEVCHARV